MAGTSDVLETGCKAQIVLLTPYTGDNRRDGAIQDSAIENIVSRVPDAIKRFEVLEARMPACSRASVPLACSPIILGKNP